MTTILIVDDHPAFRAEARLLLERDGFAVIGEAGDGRAAIDVAARVAPQVILLDIGLPDRDGFAVAIDLDRMAAEARIVLTSTRDAATYGDRLSDGPAIGFISKADLSGAAIRALLAAA
jgi:two-component system response regulator EvgA